IQSAQPGTQSGQEAAGASAQAVRAEAIRGQEVLNQAGEKLGKVDKVVRDQATNHLYAVVGVGGFLGIGEKDVTMPLREMTLLDGNLVTQSSSTTEELKQWPAYEASQYSELSANQVIDAGEFSAFEGTPIEEGSPGQQRAAPPGSAEGQGEAQPHEGGSM
ncbi:MAG: PRC-barrel domain-containing protein, partial [Chromatiaceae bacterium]